MVEQAIEKKKDLKPINGKTFAKYRNIYKEFLKSFTVQEIAEKQNCSRQYVRTALCYMAKYNEMNFKDNEEIQQAIDKTLFRQQILIALHDDSEGNAKKGIPMDKRLQLMVLKEMRKNEELIYKLKGLLNPDFIAPQMGAGSTLVVMHNMGRKSGREVIDVTPNKKKESSDASPESLILSQIGELNNNGE